tara:strand:- start:1058 stop:1789 length:732 start_codon:yes stop_codon:yes gene_type:complete
MNRYLITCKHCKHQAELCLDVSIENVSAKLRCTKCDAKGPSVSKVTAKADSIEHEREEYQNNPSDDKSTSTDWNPYIEAALAKIRSEITQIEHRSDINDAKKIDLMIHYGSASCAGIAIQPIPFADIFVLTPIQAYFGTRIAAIRGIPVSESEISEQIRELIGIVGMGFLAQQVAIGIWKTVTFGAGGLLTIPLVYALSYAVMRVIAAYYTAKAQGKKLSDDQIKEIYKAAFKEGKAKEYKHK